MAAKAWAIADIPDQRGKVAVITGGNSGIGYEAASALAGKGALVILAVRNVEKGQAAVAAIGRTYPDAAAEVMALDLSDLASVRHFAVAFRQRFESLPLDRGAVSIPYRSCLPSDVPPVMRRSRPHLSASRRQ